MVLCPRNDFRKQICDHCLGNAEKHDNVSERYDTSNEMVSDVQMTHITKPCWVGGDVEARHGVRVESVRFRTTEPQETNHILCCQNLFGDNTGGDEFG